MVRSPIHPGAAALRNVPWNYSPISIEGDIIGVEAGLSSPIKWGLDSMSTFQAIPINGDFLGGISLALLGLVISNSRYSGRWRRVILI